MNRRKFIDVSTRQAVTAAAAIWLHLKNSDASPQNMLRLEEFGVDGSASPEDFAGWNAATQAALQSGLKLVGRPGATYLFNPFLNGTLMVTPQHGQSFWLDMQGATLKFASALPSAGKKDFFVTKFSLSCAAFLAFQIQRPKPFALKI